ncbi:hypothetical protein [Chryseobacterium sp. 2987]|uniref:hypothetical protein n=1 Tax=Chryseobacterium sp. 2987 TaxID=2817767 RepID=UPI00285D27FE|nr:hypothetical protein [Chryseobacterium sp. 2987]MDR6919514.1 hypothetical protein [Chryseobacterium sp. 2987]
MEKNRPMPEIDIHGTIFQFDIDTLMLIEKGNPNNKISFAFMEDNQTGYFFEYSPLHKNHYFINANLDFGETYYHNSNSHIDPVLEVEIPRITEIDPLGFSEQYHCTTKDMVEKTDFELMVDQDAYNKRIDGNPVNVDIKGNMYEVDPVNDMLWSIDGKEDIDLKKFANYLNADRFCYELFYDPERGRAVDIYKDGFGDIELVRLIEVPIIPYLDPVGKNHAMGVPPEFGLIYTNIKLHHELTVSPNELTQIVPAKRNEMGQVELLIEGTQFIVDINAFNLRDKGDPDHKIELNQMEESLMGYTFTYKNREINIPEFCIMDTQGMAKKYNVSIDEVAAHDDFHFMVDQEAYDLRINKGRLPTIDIDGHTFTIDVRMNMLRSTTDFLSKGINFDDIDLYYSDEKDAYIIPYDPEKKEFRELDYDNLFSFPKDLIAVEFPFQTKLDPVGCSREEGWDLGMDLKLLGLKSHFEAKTIPWEQTYIVDIIKDNKEQQKKRENQQNNKNPNKNKGRKM